MYRYFNRTSVYPMVYTDHYKRLWVRFYAWVRVMVLNATFNNIWVLSWQSVLLVKETGVPWENHWPAECHWQTLSH